MARKFRQRHWEKQSNSARQNWTPSPVILQKHQCCKKKVVCCGSTSVDSLAALVVPIPGGVGSSPAHTSGLQDYSGQLRGDLGLPNAGQLLSAYRDTVAPVAGMYSASHGKSPPIYYCDVHVIPTLLSRS